MPACHAGGRGFEPLPGRHFSHFKRTQRLRAGVAQLAEQLICNQQVGGSIPFTSSPGANTIVGRFPSGQREQTVNLPAQPTVVRIHPCPPSAGMAELADALDSGSSERFVHAGSSPVSRIESPNEKSFGLFLYPLSHTRYLQINAPPARSLCAGGEDKSRLS